MPLGFADLSAVTKPGTVAVSALDAGERWTVQFDNVSLQGGPTTDIGAAIPDVEVAGPVADVMLLLWKRLPADHPTLAVTADSSSLDRLLRLDYVPDPKHARRVPGELGQPGRHVDTERLQSLEDERRVHAERLPVVVPQPRLGNEADVLTGLLECHRDRSSRLHPLVALAV